METQRTTTYRRHVRPAAIDAVRDDLARRVAHHIGRRDLKASAIRQATGLELTHTCLWRLREGDLSCMSDNRLMLLAEWLGIRLSVTFAEPSNIH